MKTLEQLHKEILASEELKAAFFEAAKDKDTLAAFLKEQGCDATIDEFTEYMKNIENSGELDDGDVEAVAGGAAKEGVALLTVIVGGILCVGYAIKSAIRDGAKEGGRNCINEAVDQMASEMRG